jgi:hypothetical protein
MATREAGDASVEVFALAIDAQARGHLQEMFGRGRYAVLPRPDGLAEAMAGVYGRASSAAEVRRRGQRMPRIIARSAATTAGLPSRSGLAGIAALLPTAAPP